MDRVPDHQEGTLGEAMAGEWSDPYAVLGLTPQATQQQVRRAYRTLLRQSHPDTRPLSDPADDAASTTLQQALDAYTLLGDPARRARYDQRTSQQTTTPTPVHPARLFTLGDPDQPPIQAGPVRWHRSR
jgi:curved DNA-binding protein CbpA